MSDMPKEIVIRDGHPFWYGKATLDDTYGSEAAYILKSHHTAEVERLQAGIDGLRNIVEGFVTEHDRALSRINTASSLYMDFSMFTYWTKKAKKLTQAKGGDDE